MFHMGQDLVDYGGELPKEVAIVRVLQPLYSLQTTWFDLRSCWDVLQWLFLVLLKALVTLLFRITCNTVIQAKSPISSFIQPEALQTSQSIDANWVSSWPANWKCRANFGSEGAFRHWPWQLNVERTRSSSRRPWGQYFAAKNMVVLKWLRPQNHENSIKSLPSGERLHFAMERSTMLFSWVVIHYFDWAIFNST